MTNSVNNARRLARSLARIIFTAVLAGELSLCSALVAGQLVKSYMQYSNSGPSS